jgi:hypothetical protein
MQEENKRLEYWRLMNQTALRASIRYPVGVLSPQTATHLQGSIPSVDQGRKLASRFAYVLGWKRHRDKKILRFSHWKICFDTIVPSVKPL